MRELTVKLLAKNITEEQIDKLDRLLMSEFKPENILITEEEYIEENKPTWVYLKDVLSMLKELDFWSIDTKYLNLYLDTRFMNGDFKCTIKDRKDNQYLTLEDLKERRHKLI